MEKVTPVVTWQRRHWRRRGRLRLYGELMSNWNCEQQSVEHFEQQRDEQQILAQHEAGDRALMMADLDVLARIFADDYVQYNESGQPFIKDDVLNNFRTGAIRYPSIVSTGRKIRVLGDTAVVHGSEVDEVEVNGKRSVVRYVYLDVLRKAEGTWKLVASQLARPAND
jgi:ketosteroid isomerase-like protein